MKWLSRWRKNRKFQSFPRKALKLTNLRGKKNGMIERRGLKCLHLKKGEGINHKYTIFSDYNIQQ